jgi:HEAT repeat protein
MSHLPLTVAACIVGLMIAPSVHARTPFFLGKSLERWQRELSDPDTKTRRSAAFALGRIGDDARSTAPDLVKRLRGDSDAAVRDMAASALGDIARSLKGGTRSLWQESGGTLVSVLKSDDDPHVRRSAAYALGAFGAQAGGAADALSAALRDKDASVRQNAAWALGQIGEQAGSAVTGLCECLSDKDVLVRRDAASALGSMGKAGAAAVAPLIDLAKSEADEVVRAAALNSLAYLAGPEHARFARGLEPLLDNKNPEIALNAAIVLARIGGTESSSALPVLRKALQDPDAHVQELATAALVNLGPNAEPAMYDLADVLTNTSAATLVRRNAALAIAHVGAAAKPVVPSLVQALKASEPVEVRRFAAEALAQMKYPANEKGVPAILDAIEKDSDYLVRQKCVWSLFGMAKVEDVKGNGVDKVLAKVLDEKSEEMTLVRYDAARKLANVLRDEAPDKTADVLLHMLKNNNLKVYNRTDAKVEGAGNEATAGKANVQANTGGDARYMAAEALAWLGDKAKQRPDVVEALRKAAKDDDPMLRKAAAATLDSLGLK